MSQSGSDRPGLFLHRTPHGYQSSGDNGRLPPGRASDTSQSSTQWHSLADCGRVWKPSSTPRDRERDEGARGMKGDKTAGVEGRCLLV